MAIDGVKPSAYQGGVATASKVSNTAHMENIDTAVNSTIYTSPDVKPVGEHETKDFNSKEEYLRSEISKANSKLQRHNIRCEFDYHEETNRITIKVMDKETDKIIREIPPEKTLDMIQKIWELAGLLIDERR